MNAPKDRNQEIAHLATARGMINKSQADECLRAVKARGEGAGTLDAILVEKGYITSVQRDVLLREMTPPEEETQVVGGYQIIKLIGKGGMGSVYRARQVSLERIVALKILNKHLTANPTYRERFHREARAAATFNHPNIVRAIDAGEEEGILYFAMELVDGKNVSTILKEEGLFEEGRAIEIARQVAMGLAHAWRKGVIHRDIKPENILIDRDRVVKLTDLGLAKFTGGEQRRITQAGMAMGTPYYISPEQIRLSEDLDIRADLYALGASLFHLVCGRPPYLAESPTAVVSMHLSTPVPDPRQYNPALSAEFSSLIMHTLAKDPKDRFQTPEQLIASLDTLRERDTVSAMLPPVKDPSEDTEGQGVGFGMIMAVVSLMAIAALVYFLAFPPGRGGDEASWDMPETTGGTESIHEPEPDEKKPPIRVKPPDTPPVEPPKTNPGDTTGEPTNRIDHEKLLREAETFLREHPDDFPGILRRLDEIRKKCEGTPSAILAEKMQKTVRRRLDEKAFQTLSGPGQGIVDRARRLKDLARFAEGLAHFDTFPENLRVGGWVERWDLARGAYLEDGRRYVNQTLRKVKDLARRGKYERALEVLREIEEFGVPGFKETIAGERGKIRTQRADTLLCEFVAELYHKATTDGFLAAEAYLTRKARDPRATSLKDDLKQAQKALEGARAVAGARDKAMAERIGRSVEIRLKSGRRMVGTLKSALPREGVIVLKGMSGAAAPFDPAEIGIGTLYDLCRLKGERGWRALASYQLFLLADIESCRQALARVPGGSDSWLRRTTDMLEETIVTELFGRVVRKRRGDPEDVYRLLETLLAKHRDAEAFQRVQRSVKAFLIESGRAIGRRKPGLPFVVRGKVQELRGERLKLVWNFGHRGQAKDLNLSGGAFRIEDGALFQTEQVKMGHAIFPMVWERYVAEADVEVSPGRGYAGLVFHYHGPGQCFYFLISGGGRGQPKVRAGLYQPYPGDAGTRLKEEHSVVLPGFDFGAVHRMKLNVDGDQFKGLLDGRLIFSKRIPRFGEGQVGIRADRPSVFSSLMVMGITAD